ncbi:MULTISPECIES: dimethylsulfonioproprionate lyase family protein [unclassified Pseudomonas]|uniref:dimethylsulfonioproprionate lyase family protein n=1 Tax=unclassified Pseudomonas TaxID=196821 RepID=UPI000B847460|nr:MULTISPECIES: dimethylsulfonioproprionate lyase family protein [unclassified Pseudomonas]
MGLKTMITRCEPLSLDPSVARSAQRLRRSLHEILSNHLGDGTSATTQACAAALGSTEWSLKKPPATPRALPAVLAPYLAQAFDAAPSVPEHLAGVLEALKALVPHVPWIHRQAQAGQDDRFVERHRHGMVTGPGGLFDCPGMTLGLALMAPETCYPFHQHPPAEFYLVLSPGDWYREDVGWWTPGAGSIVINPPSCTHAMRSTQVPLLALWGLLHEPCA